MKLFIDTDARTLSVDDGHSKRTLDLYCDKAFGLISDQWLKVGWNQKYVYSFSWMGRPIIQLPEDILRIQEVIYRVKPDLIIETGVAHGGSLIFYASFLKAMGKGRVVGIDIEIRPHNREAIEAHEMKPLITLIEGSSIDAAIVSQAKSLIKPGERCLVILDSNHSRDHVRAELEAYHDVIARDSYIVATDGSMRDLHDVPRGNPTWKTDNPCEAARDFLQTHPEFILEQPPWPFNESTWTRNLTHWPDAYLRRL
jgi:cephalosporin hydroxylase